MKDTTTTATHEALRTRPETVALLALGPTSRHFYHEKSRKKKIPHFDEVWAVNSAGNIIQCDKIWVMDDLKHVEEEYPAWACQLKSSKTPIITCRAYPEYPSSVPYPLEEVVEVLKDDYFSVTPAYAIAYAIFTGVKTMHIYGCDFYYPGSTATESGAASMCYWLGIARERKLNFRIPADSTLLDCHLSKIVDGVATGRYLYGYDYNPGKSYKRLKAGQGNEMDMLVAAGDKIHHYDDKPPPPEGKDAPVEPKPESTKR